MSLVSPNLIEKAIAHKRIILYAVAALVLLGAVLFGVDRCYDWRLRRDIEKRKANVNAKIEEVKAINANISNLQIKEAEKKTEIIEATKDLANAMDATDTERQKVDELIKTEIPKATNVSVEELQEKLRKLDQ